jgi:hypothetical protein
LVPTSEEDAALSLSSESPMSLPVVALQILVNLTVLETPYWQLYVYMKALRLAVNGEKSQNTLNQSLSKDSLSEAFC